MVLQVVVWACLAPYRGGVIDVRGATKRYGEKVAVDDLSPGGGFALYRGSTIVLLAIAAYMLVHRDA
jgi:hypothetical protein